MKLVSVRNETRGVGVAARAGVADSFWLRLRGLLGRPPLQPGEGLLITPCRAVHMLGMKYAIDVAFLDAEGRVVGVSPELAPGARTSGSRNARAALELPARTLAATGTVVGDRLVVEEVLTSTLPKRSRSAVADRGGLPGLA